LSREPVRGQARPFGALRWPWIVPGSTQQMAAARQAAPPFSAAAARHQFRDCQRQLKIPHFAPVEISPVPPVEISPGANGL
jgi:hypothetical protein